MGLVEFYYPLATLTNTGKYFSKADTSKNFAIDGGVSGHSTAYYIQSASDFTGLPLSFNINNRNNIVTHYLVIKHDTFYVLFPICNTNSLSNFVRSDITISPIRKSIDNLLISKKDNKIEFDLNSTIDSMKTFAPTSYYFNEYKDVKNTKYDVYVINAPIFVGGKIDESKYAKGIIKVNSAWTEVDATITRVEKISTCTGNIDGKKKGTLFSAKKGTLFTTKTVKEQNRLSHLNIIYGFSMGIIVLFFYHIFMNYSSVNKHWSSFTMILFVGLFLVAIPVSITAQIYNTNKKGIDKESLQHSVIFARYSIVAIALMFMTIFSKNLAEFVAHFATTSAMDKLKEFLTGLKAAVLDPKQSAKKIGVLLLSAYLMYASFYIFAV